jgi:cell filamentation protein
MYRAEPDPYCYPGTSVLINRLDIREQTVLDAFEAEITSQRATEPLPRGRFGCRHYCAIHRHLFQDVYAWAGKIRTVRISKEGSKFCYPENIDREMRQLFPDLAKQRYLRHLEARTFAERAAHFLAELNAIHPFREGNGRTQLSFLTILADQTAHPLKLERLVPSAVLAATISSFEGHEGPLVEVIANLVR